MNCIFAAFRGSITFARAEVCAVGLRGVQKSLSLNKQKTDTITYITTPEGLSAIVVASSNTAGREWYWVFADHLGSITTLVRNSDGQKFEMSYDACKVKLGFCECSETKTLVEPISYEARGREGNRRDPNTWENYNYNMPSFITDRGYTGHEHLDEFILINMNGRMYDPETARFLSPDVVIADPSNPASYNPYAYVLNNPLKYTDPSGYVVDPVSIAAYIIAGAILYSSYAKQNADPATGKWDWNFTNWFSEDKPGWMLGMTINTSFTNTTFFASMNWSNGSNTTLGYNTQYGWGGGSAPQNMYFPNYNSGASEAAAVSSIARMDRSIYFQSTSNYMDFLISQSHNANSLAMEQGLTACEGCGGDASSQGGFLYYLAEWGGHGHSMVWNPYSNKVYEIHIPGYGQDGNSKSMSFWLWVTGQGDKKAIRYVYDMATEKDLFYLTSDRMHDGKIDIRYSKVWVPDINASINFFESNEGGAWNYALPYSNCKHYAIQGLEAGGAKIKWSGPVPVHWQSSLSPFDPVWFNR